MCILFPLPQGVLLFRDCRPVQQGLSGSDNLEAFLFYMSVDSDLLLGIAKIIELAGRMLTSPV